MIKEAIEKIRELSLQSAAVVIEEIDGRKYTTQSLKAVDPPIVSSLKIHSLTGIVDFILAGNTEDGSMIHIFDHDTVYVYAPIEEVSQKRPCYIEATAQYPNFRFGHYYDLEEFIISLQSKFAPDDNCQTVLKFVSSISHDQSAGFEDDGVTQKVSVKKGITQLQQQTVPSPVVLRPYRTFSEVEQPASSFILRVMAKKDQTPYCALFGADGGAWKAEARNNIKEWLSETIEIPIIA